MAKEPYAQDDWTGSIVHIVVPTGVNSTVLHLQIAGDGCSGLLLEQGEKYFGDCREEVIRGCLEVLNTRMR